MGHRPRKRFGQNFLVDPGVVDRIVTAIDPAPGIPIVEIGPGQGALTGPLLAAGADLHVVEIDRDLAAELPRRVPGLGAERIHVCDALDTDFSRFAEASESGEIRVVGNLPYNVSTPLLVHLMEGCEAVRDMHFMLQNEVVVRMAAQPGSRDFGRLSLLCQYHCEVVPLFTVPARAFQPAPRVESAFVRLRPHGTPPVEIADVVLFRALVGQAFSQRRKTLANSLKSMIPADLIRQAGIDPGLRAEAIGLAEYAKLTEVVAHYTQREGK